MTTIAYDSDAPGRGGFGGALVGQGSRKQKVITGTFTFDNSYPTGGESCVEITDQFRGGAADVILFGQQSNRIVVYDKTNKKVLLYTALGTEAANASDQSSIVTRFIAIGPA